MRFELTRHLVKKGTKPPVAILAYTDSLPVRTLVYPLAVYSPEFQASYGLMKIVSRWSLSTCLRMRFLLCKILNSN